MKRIAFLMLMLAGFALHAQKQAKPNLGKAYSLLSEGKVAEAKGIVDAATTYEKTMNDGKTYYYRGLVYTTIDTSSNEQVHALDPNAFQIAMKSFAKADSMAGKNEYFVQPGGGLPEMKSIQMERLANYYLDKSIKKFQADEPDYNGSLEVLDKSRAVFEKQIKGPYQNDTLAYYVGAIVASQTENPEKTMDYANKYVEKGGKSRDIFLVMYQTYATGPQENLEKAMEVVNKAKKALPNDTMWPKIEIELLINAGKAQQAKSGLEDALRQNPNDKLLHFYLGIVNSKLADVSRAKVDSVINAAGGKITPKNQSLVASLNNESTPYLEAARKSYQEALRLDPTYFEAQFQLANTYLVEVDKTVKEYNATGNTAADSKRRSELIQQRTKKAEVAIPYLEKAEQMKAPDKDGQIEVLQKLSLLYYFTADDKNTNRINKKLKDLGVSDE
jgi:hypothetical protein